MKKKICSNQEKSNLLPSNYLFNYKDNSIPNNSSKTLKILFSDLDFELTKITSTSEKALLDYLIENYLWKRPSPAVNLSETELIDNVKKMTGEIFADAIMGLRRAIRDKNLTGVEELDQFFMSEESKIKGKMNKDSILIVDNHKNIRLLMSSFLKSEYNVVTKHDELTALSWLSKGNIPQLIILNISLPYINGIEFLNNIRSSGFFSQIPVIIVSDNENKLLKDKCHELGISAYLTKPFSPLDLQTSISKICSITNSVTEIKLVQ
jgi:CheY-like chemotaxis protein